jgi:hypothetical protein
MRTLTFTLLLGLAIPAAALPDILAPSHFASGAVLETPGHQPFYRIELPLAVYAQARPDLGDVRVFNADGDALAYALELPRPPVAHPDVQSVPRFPHSGSTAPGTPGLDLRIEQSAQGRIVALRSPGSGAAASVVNAYLFDLSALRRPVQALRLDWPAGADYSAPVRLEGSDDLKHWHFLAESPLLDMRFGGRQLAQKRIAFDAGTPRYLRLSANAALPAFTRADVELLPERQPPAPERRWQEVTATAGDKPGEYVFDLGAELVATQLEIRLPQLNTVAPVELLVRRRHRDNWQSVTHTTVYRLLRDSGEIASPALDIAPQPGRYWLLRLDPRAGSLGRGMPVLRLGWTPHRLVFVAQGRAPFTLAWGQRDAKPAALPLASLLPGYRANLEAELPPATPGAVTGLGGSNAPQPGREDAPPPDWKRWLLWGVLLAGVALLAFMARSLMRQPPRAD